MISMDKPWILDGVNIVHIRPDSHRDVSELFAGRFKAVRVAKINHNKLCAIFWEITQ